MDEQNFTSQNPQEKKQDQRKPSIRTMKSDVEELFKTTKPSLIQIIGREDAAPIIRQIPRASSSKKVIIFLMLLFALLCGSFVVYYFVLAPALISTPQIPLSFDPPAPFFSTEQSETVSGSFENRVLLLQKIEGVMRERAREGTIKYIPIKLEEKGHERFANADDIIQLYRMRPPQEFSLAIESSVMPFVYYSEEGSRFGMAFRVRDANRMLRNMLTWESSILSDFTPLFFSEKPEIIVAPFEDRAFRNIDWRFLNLSHTKDLGIGYSFFPAKKVFILTSSKEAIETIISRLYVGL